MSSRGKGRRKRRNFLFIQKASSSSFSFFENRKRESAHKVILCPPPFPALPAAAWLFFRLSPPLFPCRFAGYVRTHRRQTLNFMLGNLRNTREADRTRTYPVLLKTRNKGTHATFMYADVRLQSIVREISSRGRTIMVSQSIRTTSVAGQKRVNKRYTTIEPRN